MDSLTPDLISEAVNMAKLISPKIRPVSLPCPICGIVRPVYLAFVSPEFIDWLRSTPLDETPVWECDHG